MNESRKLRFMQSSRKFIHITWKLQNLIIETNIFQKSSFDDNYFINNVSNLSINNSLSNNIINLDEDEENNEKDVIKNENEELNGDNNLFVRKSTNKILLAKKKIQYTKNFIERELNSLDILPIL